jgi:hypothetical protein
LQIYQEKRINVGKEAEKVKAEDLQQNGRID